MDLTHAEPVARPGDEIQRELLRELARSPAGARFRCVSPSMEPTICVGQSVRIFALPSACLRVGDVVVLEGARGEFVLHRIFHISGDREWLYHAGDAEECPALRRAPMEVVVGRVRDHYRRLEPLSFKRRLPLWARRHARALRRRALGRWLARS